jgi:hypothetical protein
MPVLDRKALPVAHGAGDAATICVVPACRDNAAVTQRAVVAPEN